MADFTEGPWNPEFNSADETGAEICTIYQHPSSRFGYIADVYLNHVGSTQDKTEFKANSHLIAAAPDLYEALDGLLTILENIEGLAGYHLNGDLADIKELEDFHDAIAALKKARGEQ